MSVGDPGLVALDPVRLVELEATFRGVGDGYRSQAGHIIDVLAEVGESAMGEAAEIHAVAEWCHRHGDDIADRRSLLAALPAALPLPPRTFETRTEAWRAAEALAPRLRRVLDTHPVSWERLAPLLAEAARGTHDGAFAARLLTLLGPERTAALPMRIEGAARAAGAGEAADSAQAIVAGALLAASRHTGPGRLSEGWIARFAGPDDPGIPPRGGAAPAAAPRPETGPGAEAVLTHLGFGTDLARAIAAGLGAGRLVVALRGADTVLTVARVVGGDGEGDGWDVAALIADVAGSLGLTLVTAGVVSTPLGVTAVVGGSIVASAVAWLLRQVEAPPAEQATPEARHRRSARTFDPETGTSHYPGGGPDRPHQDGAGGVLPPNVVR